MHRNAWILVWTAGALVACAPQLEPSAPSGNPVSAHREESSNEDASAQIDPRFSAALARVQRAMRPVCGKRCGSVALEAVGGIGASAQTNTRIPGYSIIEIRKETIDDFLSHTPAVLFWAVAHEYGHHLDIAAGNANLDGEWGLELRAEALAGCALQRAHVPIDPVFEMSLQNETGSRQGDKVGDLFGSDGAHPAWRHMRRALLNGHAACSDGAGSVDEVAASVSELTAEVLRNRSPLLRSMAERASSETTGKRSTPNGEVAVGRFW